MQQVFRWNKMYNITTIYIYNINLKLNFIEGLNYLDSSYLIFLIGVFGLLFNYKNFLVSMLNIELIYLGIVTGFAVLSIIFNDFFGQIYALVILILAAAESAVGLGILIVLFKYGQTVDFSIYQELKG
jgi:NADH-quinone oxidoreductase subunit K